MDKIEIPLSKTRILILIVGAIAFVIIGIFFIVTPDTFISPIFRNTLMVRLAGVAAVVFFGATGVYGIRKLFDKTMGLIVDERGITDNTNASSIGLIDWSDITEIKTEQVMSTRFLLIFTTNPDKYLDRVHGFRRKLVVGNMKMYGTPLSIVSTTLNYDFDDLELIINKRLVEQREKAEPLTN